jgi:CHAT domain-containing protein
MGFWGGGGPAPEVWYRSYGNWLWDFDGNGLMQKRTASINDSRIQESDSKFPRWPLAESGPRIGAPIGRGVNEEILMSEPRVTRCLAIRLLALQVLMTGLPLVSIHDVFLPTPVLASQAHDAQQRLRKADQLMAQGTDHLSHRRFPAALHSFEQAVQVYQELKDEDRLAGAQNNRAKAALLAGDYAQAIELWQRLADRGESGTLLSNLGLALFETGRLPQAERVLRRAIAYWESVRSGSDQDASRITLFEQQAHTYRLLQRVLVAQNKADQALELADWSRARPLVELLVRRERSDVARRPPSRPLSLDEIKQIARAESSVLVEYSIVGREIRVLGDEPEDQSDLFIWVVRPTGEVAFRRVDLTPLRQGSPDAGAGLTQLVARSRYSLGIGGRGLVFQGKREPLRRSAGTAGLRGDAYHELQALHKLLIRPIADLLPNDPEARVTVIPQGSLFLVPFAALQDDAGRFLIEKHTLLTAPSIRMLALTHDQRQRLDTLDLASLRDQDALVVGNPVMPRFPPAPGDPAQPLANLPGAEQEAKAIAVFLHTKPLIRDQALKTAVLKRLPQSRIVHLATHALLDIDPSLNEFGVPTDPLARTARESNVFVTPGAVVVGPRVFVGGGPAESALARERVVRVEMPGLIALAPSSGDDGFLSAKEILAMRLVARLVVLSACNTGRGRVTGDGVVGLSRAFIAAGVPSVIVSLWTVPDTPTSSLMTTFYQHLKASPDKARALRLAMLATLRRHSDPVDWAGFTLVGNAR